MKKALDKTGFLYYNYIVISAMAEHIPADGYSPVRLICSESGRCNWRTGSLRREEARRIATAGAEQGDYISDRI